MATASILPDLAVEERIFAGRLPIQLYLSTSYRPDREYVDGELLERNVGEKPHARLQRIFFLMFCEKEAEWNVEAFIEQRVQVSESRYRVPDVCAIPRFTQGLVIATAPLLCIEVLSREDRMSEMQERVDDYLRMGVPAVWIVDPWARRATSVDGSGAYRTQREELTVSGTSIRIDLGEVFARLDALSGLSE